MQKLTLSYSRTNRYLQTLVKQDVISYDQINHTFEITPKGRRVLTLNQQLATYISPVDAMIRRYSRYIGDPNDDDYQIDDNFFSEGRYYPAQNSSRSQLTKTDTLH